MILHPLSRPTDYPPRLETAPGTVDDEACVVSLSPAEFVALVGTARSMAVIAPPAEPPRPPPAPTPWGA